MVYDSTFWSGFESSKTLSILSVKLSPPYPLLRIDIVCVSNAVQERGAGGGQVELINLVKKCPLGLPDVLLRSVIDFSPLLPTGSVASAQDLKVLFLILLFSSVSRKCVISISAPRGPTRSRPL
jgi:hypothetical protein